MKLFFFMRLIKCLKISIGSKFSMSLFLVHVVIVIAHVNHAGMNRHKILIIFKNYNFIVNYLCR